ncbi:uncharacterized protein LOC125225847 [Leguminivora glycinivorella]|uniref:uncharacterized protein LOC125225847 n=1 Tax=Leguminivora glycinivorella TaxID=1035111 RepID=UPI00201064C6|nr:uncharacterized protein LOC125225847 [Leguminivora glycinivorella]
MSKFVIIFLVATFAACITADDNGDGSTSFMGDFMKPFSDTAKAAENLVKNLKPAPNERVQATYTEEEHHLDTVDGKVVDQGDSQKKIKNDNGKVTENTSKH